MVPVRTLAAEIEATLAPARAAFARLCPGLCPDCADPCCQRVSPHGLLDQTDVLYLAVRGWRGTPLAMPTAKGCPFLTPGGCGLPWQARPFACLRYLCRPIQRALAEAELAAITSAITRAAALRSRLMAAFLDGDGPAEPRGQP
ncbi:MAG: hypothetical protein LDL11_00710 [Desulfarculus sp.]|nr:hypothetical protein [Desulfarculus sp.]